MSSSLASCPRCGVERQARKQGTLCSDCQSALSPIERKAWAPTPRQRVSAAQIVASAPSTSVSLTVLSIG